MKRLVRSAILAAAGVGLVALPARAQEAIDNTAFGTTSAEFLLLGAGARGAALGGSFAAIANDVTALYWNPAGLALMSRPGASFSVYDYIADTQYAWAGIAFPLDGGQRAIGFHGATFGFSGQPVYTVETPEGDGSTYGVSETYVGLTYAQNFSDRFSAGLTGKFISDALGETRGQTFAFDFGTNFHASVGPRPIRASFVIQNLGGTLKHDGSPLRADVIREPPTDQQNVPQEPQPARLRSKDFTLPIVFRFGLAFDFVNTASSRVTVLSEFTQPNNSNATANGAFEYGLANIGGSPFHLTARGGYTFQPDNDLAPNQDVAGFATGLSGDEDLDGLAFGGGLAYDRGTGFALTLDYAWRSLGILGGTNFFSASVHW